MKILVVDDDNIFRSLVQEVLEGCGYIVSAHPNGRSALDYLLSEGADIAVLDINMPELDGIALLASIRAAEGLREMPVLLLTVRGLAEDQVRGYNIGADDYLTKPFSNEMLAARVKVLERRILSMGK